LFALWLFLLYNPGTMPLEPGTRLGPYELAGPLGAGGMGEVHKATDTRLNRTVAIKVLPARFSEDAEMKQRFEREAKTIAALNHPNICTLYDVGKQGDTDFLVMEYLEGETLAQRLARGSLPLDEALAIAIAMADALDKAHAQGVTHRDLKPGNVMLTASGAKLLDFGLAKLGQPSPDTHATAPGMDSTVPGTILGTMPYMAPEQLEGRDAGPRTDIFAFGAVLYEMVTGKRAFDGKSQAVLIAAIISADPDPLLTLRPEAPPALAYTVDRCLEKDPSLRIQTAWDLLCQLRWIAEGDSQAGETKAKPKLQRQEQLTWAALGLVLLIVAALLFPTVRYVAGADAPPQNRFLVSVPDMPVPEAVAMSPDGRAIAYAGRDSGGTALFIRPTDGLVGQKVAGTEGAGDLFWSPDNKAVAFFAAGQLKIVDVAGASVRNVCETPDLQGGTWNVEGVILFGSSKGLQRVPAAGGQPVAVSGIGADANAREPYFLPDGRHFLYLAGKDEKAAIYAGALDSTDVQKVLDAQSNVRFVADPGYLLYHRQGTLYAHPFNPGRLSLSGEPIRLADVIPYSDNGAGAFSASQTGILIYRSTPPTPTGPAGLPTSNVTPTALVWVDRAGKTTQRLGNDAGWRGIDLASDERRVAVHRHDANGGDIHIFQPNLELPDKFTFDAAQDNSSPIWSPDDKRIAFASRRNGKWGLYVKLADRTGGEELLLESPDPIVPMSWRDDVLVYSASNSRTARDIAYLKMSDTKKEPVVFLQTAADERNPQLSPDGKWIAYSSNHTGRSEIYVRPFPKGEGLVQISTNGGVFPRWRQDQRELYFMNLVSVGAMLAVDIGIQGTELRKNADPHPLFQTGYFDGAHSGGIAHAYAVSRNGQRFILAQIENIESGIRGASAATLQQTMVVTVAADRAAAVSGGARSPAPIHVVLNWTTALKR
jgi:eukaryotic-like serine/threonine-protein kinase